MKSQTKKRIKPRALSDIDRQRLAGTLAGLDWVTIDDLYQSAVTAGVFNSGHFAKCIDMHSKAALRRILKSGRLKQADGAVIRVVSLTAYDYDARSGGMQKIKFYKREDLLSFEEFWQVSIYWVRRENHARKMIRHYIELARKKHGVNLEAMLPYFKENDL